MLDRHSLFWKLAILLVGFCLLMIGLSYTWGRHMETQNAFLSEPARQTLRGYAAEAEPVSYTHLTLPTSDLV